MKCCIQYCLLLLISITLCESYSYGSPRSPQQKNVQNHNYKNLISVYESRNLEFGFPSNNERIRALNNGNYVPDVPVPIDVDVYYLAQSPHPIVFMTIPRFGKGVPYSLAYLTQVQRPNGTEIQPFPDYNTHRSHGADCNGLTSVYRVQIDSCGQMWVLDSGEIDMVQFCAPQIVVYDLKNRNKIVHRYRLPQNVFKTGKSRFITPLVDITDRFCRSAFVYMADTTGSGIVVYDVSNARSWRIENKYTSPDPNFSTHTIAGESFELNEGAFGLTVTPRGLGLRRLLYFHSIAHDLQVAIPLDIVNNPANWNNGMASAIDQFIPLGRRGVQCAITAMTRHGYLLCGYYNPIGIVAWNIRTPYTFENRLVIAENPQTLQFVSGLKIITNPHSGKDEAWMVSNRLQKVFAKTINYRETNYRIQKCGVDEMLRGAKC